MIDDLEDLGNAKNIEVMQRFVDLAGKRVLDIGCGGLAFSKLMAETGARVLAIDPDSVQAEKNRALDPIPNIEFVESGAEKLPAEDHSCDGVTLAYSLHHVPEAAYPEMFKEISRVLKPGGFLYVIEPTDCDGNEVLKHFHDETEVRKTAWDALHRLGVPLFDSCEAVTYYSITQFESWEAYVDRYASKSFNTGYSEADVRAPIVQETYERLAGPENQLMARKYAVALLGLK